MDSDNIADKRQEALKRIPVRCQRVMRQAWAGNRPAAVKAKCLECCGFQRLEVRLCQIVTCPLWEFRPKSRRKVKNEE